MRRAQKLHNREFKEEEEILAATIGMQRRSVLLNWYFRSCKRLESLNVLSKACLNGVWLGVLKREDLHSIDKLYYDDRANRKYCNEHYNRRGLRTWERSMVDRYFSECKSLLVAAVGGGREILALRQSGYDADGFECHHQLAESANELLRKEGLVPNVKLAPRDTCPDWGRMYDGLIVGWGTYTYIQGRRQRVEFLRQLRAQARENAPILLSFYTRSHDELYLKVILAIGNSIRWVMRRDLLALGDDLIPHYVHRFTEKELAAELDEAEYELRFYSAEEYGHAVAAPYNHR